MPATLLWPAGCGRGGRTVRSSAGDGLNDDHRTH